MRHAESVPGLEGAEGGKRGLGASIQVDPGCFESVVSSAGRMVVEECAGVISTQEPTGGSGEADDPQDPPSTEMARRHASAIAQASIGCWSNAGPNSWGPRPPTGVKLKSRLAGFSLISHSRRSRPSAIMVSSPSIAPAAMRASGNSCVVVGEARLGPFPGATVGTGKAPGSADEKRLDLRGGRPGPKGGDCAQNCVSVGSRMGTVEVEALAERQGHSSGVLGGQGRSQAPESTAVCIVRASGVDPDTKWAHPVVPSPRHASGEDEDSRYRRMPGRSGRT